MVIIGFTSTISSILSKSMYFSLKTKRFRWMTRIFGSEYISVCFETFRRLRQLSQESSSVSGSLSSSKNLLRHWSNVTLFKFSGLGRFMIDPAAPPAIKLWDLCALLRLMTRFYWLDSSPRGSERISSVSYLCFGLLQERHVMQSPMIPWNISVIMDLSRSSSDCFTARKYSFLSTRD